MQAQIPWVAVASACLSCMLKPGQRDICMPLAKCKWVKRRKSVLWLLVADPGCFRLGRAAGQSHMTTGWLLFSGALAGAGQR